jgi:hypothetical protein
MGMSNASVAATLTPQASVGTIAELSITQVEAISFGSGVPVAVGTSCTLEGSEPDEATYGIDYNGTDLSSNEGTNWDLLSAGDCIDNGDASSGVFRVEGEPGLSFSIHAQEKVDAVQGITYSPANGCYLPTDGDAVGVATDTAEVCTYLGKTKILGATILNATEVGGAYSMVAAGDAYFTLGGILTIQSELTAETAYTVDFDIVVAYE